jgi:DNA-binding response OmpR family regulator
MDGNFNHKILVVDDDSDILTFIEHEFSPFSVDIFTCETVDEAISLLGQEVFSFAVIDIVMGEGQSSERLIKFIKEDFAGENKNLPLAIISAHMKEAYAKKLRLKGTNVFATYKKPLHRGVFAKDLLGKNHKSIMMLEDDPDIMSLVKNELIDSDYRIYGCENTQLGEKIVDLMAIDFLVIDNKLGAEEDSSPFIHHIEQKHPDLPCILTGKDIKEELKESVQLNIIGILSKPMKPGSLLQMIDEHFAHPIEEDRDKTIIAGERIDLSEGIIKVSGKVEEDQSTFKVSGDGSEVEKDEVIRVRGSSEAKNASDIIRIKGSGQNEKSNELMVIKSLFMNEEVDQSTVSQVINHRNKNGQTPVMIYCYLGELDKVKILIDKGADLKLKSRNGKTCLHYAAFSGNTELLNYLVQFHGLRINDRDENNLTPLYDAIKIGNLDMVKACVELGARLNFSLEGKSYLTIAVLYGKPDVVRYLYELGIPTDKKDYKGHSPIDYAKKKKNRELIEALNVEVDFDEEVCQ